MPKARLADLLWTDRLPQNHLAALETYVSILRHTLEPGVKPKDSVIITERGGYRLDVSRVTVDLDDFDELLRKAGGLDPVQASEILSQALAIPRGQAMEDEPYADWAQQIRDRYNIRHVQALIDAGRVALLTGDPNAALEYARQAVAINPLAEAAYQVLMTAAYATWRQEEALQAFDLCRRTLAEELGIDPLDETVALHMAILRHEDAAGMLPPGSAPTTSAASVSNAGDDELPLLGRTAELERLTTVAQRALEGNFSLLLVVGEAGIGKTRLVESLATTLGVPVGWNRCSDLESELPYAALSLALRPVLAPTAGGTIRSLTEVFRRSADSRPFDEFARLETMENLAAEMSEVGPFLLVLDDVQWADEATITTLGYLRRRSPNMHVVVVLTCTRTALRREALRRLDIALRIDLDVLTEQELAPLGDPEIYEVTGGHPLFVSAWHDARKEGLAEPFPASLRDRVVTRCWDLGPAAYRLLTIASVLDPPVKPDLLAALVETDVGAITGELDLLVEQMLLTGEPDGFRFRHRPEREILSETMSPMRRQMLAQQARTWSLAVPRRRSTDVSHLGWNDRRQRDRDTTNGMATG